MNAHRLFENGPLKNGRGDQPIDFSMNDKRRNAGADVCRKHGHFRAMVSTVGGFQFRIVVMIVAFAFHLEMRMKLSRLIRIVNVKIRRIRQPGHQAGDTIRGRCNSSHGGRV